MNIFASFLLSSPALAKKAGALFAKEIMALPAPSRALVVGLEGELGSGKTTFAQGFIRAFGVAERVTSPTFLIFKKFELLNSNPSHPFARLYHIDCYRLSRPEELLALGWKDMVSDPAAIILAEWSDRIKPLMPSSAARLLFEHVNLNARLLRIVSL